MNHKHERKKCYQFILSIRPKQKLTQIQENFLFRENLEEGLFGNWIIRSDSELRIKLILSELEKKFPYLGTNLMPYSLEKREIIKKKELKKYVVRPVR